MNVDIQNYGIYRVTSHGGRRFDLFNRRDDLVYRITKEEYEYIMCCEFRRDGCEHVEHQHLAAVEFKL